MCHQQKRHHKSTATATLYARVIRHQSLVNPARKIIQFDPFKTTQIRVQVFCPAAERMVVRTRVGRRNSPDVSGFVLIVCETAETEVRRNLFPNQAAIMMRVLEMRSSNTTAR